MSWTRTHVPPHLPALLERVRQPNEPATWVFLRTPLAMWSDLGLAAYASPWQYLRAGQGICVIPRWMTELDYG